MTRAPAQLMETYLSGVVMGGRLELIVQIARHDMVDEADQAFGDPRRAGLVAHVEGLRRNDLVDGQISRYRVWLHALSDEPVVFDSSRPVLPRSAQRPGGAPRSPGRAGQPVSTTCPWRTRRRR